MAARAFAPRGSNLATDRPSDGTAKGPIAHPAPRRRVLGHTSRYGRAINQVRDVGHCRCGRTGRERAHDRATAGRRLRAFSRPFGTTGSGAGVQAHSHLARFGFSFGTFAKCSCLRGPLLVRGPSAARRSLGKCCGLQRSSPHAASGAVLAQGARGADSDCAPSARRGSPERPALPSGERHADPARGLGARSGRPP